MVIIMPKKPPRCSWCSGPLRPARYPGDRIFCKRSCRQAAWRVRVRFRIDEANARPMCFGFLDPPYPGKAWMYKDQPSYKGEVDHVRLIAEAEAKYDGFALSTSAAALVDVLPMFKRKFHVCAWCKLNGISGKTYGIQSAWEPLIVVPGRELRPGKRDWFAAHPARGGGDLVGRKSSKYCVWMFGVLGMVPGDSLEDLFPGSGIVGRAWAELCRAKGVLS